MAQTAKTYEPQTVKISNKRQITIPAKWYRDKQFKDYAIVEYTDEGILIKDADALQTARKIRRLVLDKTGTLTVGRPEVVKSKWFDESAKGILLAMEQASEHPLAPAISS